MAPAEGVPAVDYSVVLLTTDAAKKPLVAVLEKYLASDDARSLLQHSGFRLTAAEPDPPSPLYGTISVAGEVGGAPLAKATGIRATASLWIYSRHIGSRGDAAGRHVVAITGGQYVAATSLDRVQPALVTAPGS